MLGPAVILLRLAQYVGGAGLFGASLILVWGLRPDARSVAGLRWTKGLFVGAAALALIGSGLGLLAQTAVMAGSWELGLQPASLAAVAFGTGLGRASLARASAAALALAALAAMPSEQRLWRTLLLLGAVVCASFAWMGHGAATEGPGGVLHLAADALHALAAAGWVGALGIFLALLAWPTAADRVDPQALHRALSGFAGLGSLLVASLIATGLINGWFLVGPAWRELATTAYGRLLLVKLAAFAAMLGLAAANRFRLTPGLAADLVSGRSPRPALARLRRSVLLETALGLGVLALVAGLGTLAPIRTE